MQSKLKHLEFIQATIARMNSNSFVIKGWAITLISALFALAAKDTNQLYVIISYVPCFMFWILDGFFLSREKRFRKHYDMVRKVPEEKIDFSMDVRALNSSDMSWVGALFSAHILVFYGFLFATILGAMFLIK